MTYFNRARFRSPRLPWSRWMPTPVQATLSAASAGPQPMASMAPGAPEPQRGFQPSVIEGGGRKAPAKPVLPANEMLIGQTVGVPLLGRIAAGVPKPRVYVVPEQSPNAFATGRDPEHSSIAVTQGLLDAMDRVELEGVIGHEMSHVVDRDILYGTIVATIIGAMVLMSEFFMRSWLWGGIGGRRGGDRSSGGGGVQLIVFAIGFAMIVLAPIFGRLIQLAVSRNREYLADAQGALLTRYPPGLISALKKIQAAPQAMRSANNATAHMWLNQPSRIPGEETGRVERLFPTHPPMAERIRRLEEM